MLRSVRHAYDWDDKVDRLPIDRLFRKRGDERWEIDGTSGVVFEVLEDHQ